MELRRGLIWFVVLAILAGAIQHPVSVHAQTPQPPPGAEFALNSMTPEERVGQLFLVTFNGTDTGTDSQIYNLVVRHHVGGVILQASGDNFVAAPDTITGVRDLIERLQDLEWQGTMNPPLDPTSGEMVRSVYVPLFIGISQGGRGSLNDQILTGLTPMPSEMAIGAAWSPELATLVGETFGRELTALGFNLYLGPSLDVVESISVTTAGDPGTSVFGGDPYWVGEMGRAFISGLHLGSENRMLVIAKHFPGRGGSDRQPDLEVPTIRKSLEQLKQIELAPFFAVTGNATSPESSADGLLVSHIRYQGFQGNIRATTRPVSFDAQALGQILALPQFSQWYASGGLIVSDDLGTLAVRDFYAPGSEVFAGRIPARDAFLAGNDLLNLGGIVSSDESDTYNTTLQILEYFAQKYREDPAFAQRVDAAALRVLTAKYELFGRFALGNVLRPSDRQTEIGTSSAVTFNVARDAATLISPDLQDLAVVIPSPPQARERMVFLTDTIPIAQCSTCPEKPVLAVDALQQAILRLYGPESGNNQTSDFRLSSHSFEGLRELLDGLKPPFIESDISRADWVVLLVADASRGQTGLISRFMSERQDLLRDKHLILFSLGAPYYFDATNISKFTAYYALYGQQAPFVDVAARLLFQELTPTGASPVSIPGIGYDLISVMTPDPDQIISLSLDLAPVPIPTGTPSTPEPTAIPFFKIGDTIAVRTGMIVDHNGHPVPDGTVVQFSMVLTGEGGGILQQVETVTTQGVGRGSFGLDKPGLLEIHAVSEPAGISKVLQLDVSQAGQFAVTVIVPELTQSSEPTLSAPELSDDDGFVSPTGYPKFPAWLLAMLLILLSAGLAYWLGGRFLTPRAGIRWALGILVGGLLGYNYLILGLPGGADWLSASGLGGVLGFVILGELLGLGAGWYWSRR
jgi:beta-N-acetylhexosaminidase